MSQENKQKFALWIHPEVLNKVDKVYREADCQSKSEFIERAIDFYYGFVTADNYKTYLPNIVISTLKSIVAESDTRQNRMIFKLAVEIAILEDLIALQEDIDPLAMERLRGECVQEVKRLNGSFKFEDALEWQK